MLYVKIMNKKSLSDDDRSSNYKLVTVQNNQIIEFCDSPSVQSTVCSSESARFSLEVRSPDGEVFRHDLFGNAYVMNESGKTIATHCA